MKAVVITKFLFVVFIATLFVSAAQAEILAMMNYETKSADSLKSLKLTAPPARREGIAIIDVDPQSTAFGNILADIPLPADLVAHHIFYDRTMSKAYVTSLGKGELRVMDLTANPYRLKTVKVAGCIMGEDVVFDESNTTWYLTCMGSGNVFVGDVATDAVRAEIKIPDTYPHGLAIHTGIDRMLVTSTVSGDLKDVRESITVVELSTHKVLRSIKLSNKPSPSAEAPVEVLFVPGANPPTAYVTNMFGNTLWMVSWNAAKQDFDAAQVFDFASVGAGVPLEMYFTPDAKTLYVSTAKPGHLHEFDISAGLATPRLVKSVAAGEGAHHVGFTKDYRYGFVQNALLNLPGMSDGSVTVVDLQSGKVLKSMDTLKNDGFNPNSLVLLPHWNDLAGH
jgi:DNA-binding beta-propeller fold protein YncE